MAEKRGDVEIQVKKGATFATLVMRVGNDRAESDLPREACLALAEGLKQAAQLLPPTVAAKEAARHG